MRALVIADSGAVMAALTRSLVELEDVELRHANGRTHVDALVRAFGPELVLIGEMDWPRQTLARIAEAREAAGTAAIVVLASNLDGSWLAEALRTGATAVMPASAGAETFRRVLHEVHAQVPEAA